MTDYVLSSRTTEYRVLTSGHAFLMPQGVYITDDFGTTFDLNDCQDTLVVIDGYILSDGYIGIGGSALSARNTIVVGENGLVTAGTGVATAGDDWELRNDGRIHAGATGVSLETVDGGRVLNSGEISAGTGDGVVLSGTDLLLNNSGRITSLQATGITITGSDGWVQNEGTVSGLVGMVLVAAEGSTGAGAQVLNHGLIVGSSGTAVAGSALDESLRNAGRIDGDVELGGGADLYRGGGESSVEGTIFGEAGNDDLRGGAAGDSLSGGAGDDFLAGRVGDDRLEGGDGSDTLRGRRDDDTLLGGSGADDLSGGGGEDVLAGGPGRDSLRGGSGCDTFVFTRNGSDRDYVLDFRNNTDLLDLTDLNLAGVAGFRSLAKTVKGNTIIDPEGDGWLKVVGITEAQLADDVIL